MKFKQKPKAKYKSNKSQKNKHFSTVCFSGLKRARAIPSRQDAIAFDARWRAV